MKEPKKFFGKHKLAQFFCFKGNLQWYLLKREKPSRTGSIFWVKTLEEKNKEIKN